MAVKLLRAPSETANINNTDDFVGLRYSYGDQSGYVKNKGSEIGYQVNGSTFKILSGRIVLQGVECDIDANGYDILVDSVATERYHTVYLQVSLANMTVQILSVYSTSDYPSVSPGADLTANTTGIARLKLYQFNSKNGIISNVVKSIERIDYIGQNSSVSTAKIQRYAVTEEKLATNSVSTRTLQNGSVTEEKLATNSVSTRTLQNGSVTNEKLSGNISKSKLETGIINDYDTTKGTIEARLSNLGFRQGSISGTNISNATLTRQGNYVIGKFTASGSFSFTLPVNFRPKTTVTSSVGTYYYDASGRVYRGGGGTITFNTDGSVSCEVKGNWQGSASVCFGFEANPI